MRLLNRVYWVGPHGVVSSENEHKSSSVSFRERLVCTILNTWLIFATKSKILLVFT